MDFSVISLHNPHIDNTVPYHNVIQASRRIIEEG